MKRLFPVACILSIVPACGGDEAAPPAAAKLEAPQALAGVVPNGEKIASIAGALPDGATAPHNPFASFDFKGGAAYPARAQVRIGDIDVPVGASEAHVPITLDRPTPNTIIARVTTRNGSGGTYGVSGQHFTAVDTQVIFRPGDPLKKTVRIPLSKMDAGRHFDVIFPEGVNGGANADGRGKVVAVVGAAPSVEATSGFRKARPFYKTGTLAYELKPASVTWSNNGSTDAWSTRLPHGRTQPGNAETGLYLDPILHQSPLPPLALENGEVVIRSQHLISPIQHEGSYWHHGAAVLTGQRMPATQISYGQYEWVAKMPNRRGGWPALWLLPTTGWPPEIDVYEGFGYSQGWNFSNNHAANIHGGAFGKRTFTAISQINAERVYGMKGFDTSYHGFGVDIAPDFITWFVDGREVYQAVNPFRGTTWFPLMNVAVKHQGDYAGGTGEMRVRSFKVWKVPG